MKNKIIIAVIILIFVTVAGCANNSEHTQETTKVTTEVTEVNDTYSKLEEAMEKEEFYSPEAEDICKALIKGDDNMSEAKFKAVASFLSTYENWEYDPQNLSTQNFMLSENIILELNGRHLRLRDQKLEEYISVIKNVDIFDYDEDLDDYTLLSHCTIKGSSIYFLGEKVFELPKNSKLLKTGNMSKYCFENGDGTRLFLINADYSGNSLEISKVDITNNLLKNTYESGNLKECRAACLGNSLFYKNEKNEIIHVNLLTLESKVEEENPDFILMADNSGVYWVDVTKVSGKVYPMVSSSPEAEKFVSSPKYYIGYDGEKKEFEFYFE